MEIACIVARGVSEGIKVVSLIVDIKEAVKTHKRRSCELVKRAELVKTYLERLQQRGAVPKSWEGTLELLRQSLGKTKAVIEECGRGNVYRALNYARIKERLEEAWNGLGDALQDLGAVCQLEERLSEVNDSEEDLAFGDLEIAYRRGRMDRRMFVDQLLEMGRISVADVKECQLELLQLQAQLQNSSQQLEAAQQQKQEQEDYYLEQIIEHLATLCPVPESVAPLAVPAGHLCSICFHPMLDPVCTLRGHTYCRHCIEQWFGEGNQTNPGDNGALQSTLLVDNIALRLSVESCLNDLEPFRSSRRETWNCLIKRHTWVELPGSRRLTDVESSRASMPSQNTDARMEEGDLAAIRVEDAEAQNEMGMRYEKGEGVEKNLAKAYKWYRKSAKQKSSKGQYNLGRCHENGWGVFMDVAEACKWYRKSAEQGDACGQFKLGVCHQNGWGVPKDNAKACMWYRKSAEQGNAAAQNSFGVCCEYNWGVSRNLSEAFSWYRRSAEQGDADGEYNLGRCYENALGVSQNLAEACTWYSKSAEQGCADAQNNLGWYFENGWGVPRNHAEAFECFKKSAEQGSSVAQFNLGVCYERGFGVGKDLEEADRWYRKAKYNGKVVKICNSPLQKKIFRDGHGRGIKSQNLFRLFLKPSIWTR